MLGQKSVINQNKIIVYYSHQIPSGHRVYPHTRKGPAQARVRHKLRRSRRITRFLKYQVLDHT